MSNLQMSTVLVAIPIALGTAAFFEHFRYLVTQHHRKHKLRTYWEEIQIETSDNSQRAISYLKMLADYLLLPVTYTIGWFMPSGRQAVVWKQKFYHSLSVAGRFVNPFIEWEDRNTTDFFAYIKWQVTRKNRNGVPNATELEKTLPVVTPNFDLLFKRSEQSMESSWVMEPNENNITCTWIGQSTLFVQMDGYNILTDPIFSRRTIGDWFGPKRLTPVPCDLSELPRIDIVLISHNHYDHLDVGCMKEIGNSARWYVPMGLAKWFKTYGVTNVVELDWWQEYYHDDRLLIASTPIQHWSGRHFFDVNSSLWSSFVCKTESKSFFHCGDTGYCTAFKEIGAKYGPISFAALPIGSYEPRYFMCHQHMNPEEACKVHEDLGAKHSIGVHWGTFMMSDEHYLDPPKDFEAARVKLQLPKGSVFTTNIGQTILIN